MKHVLVDSIYCMGFHVQIYDAGHMIYSVLMKFWNYTEPHLVVMKRINLNRDYER